MIPPSQFINYIEIETLETHSFDKKWTFCQNKVKKKLPYWWLLLSRLKYFGKEGSESFARQLIQGGDERAMQISLAGSIYYALNDPQVLFNHVQMHISSDIRPFSALLHTSLMTILRVLEFIRLISITMYFIKILIPFFLFNFNLICFNKYFFVVLLLLLIAIASYSIQECLNWYIGWLQLINSELAI